jgi:hypothetical protein
LGKSFMSFYQSFKPFIDCHTQNPLSSAYLMGLMLTNRLDAVATQP